MNLILYDRAEAWADLLPLTFTRPIGELRLGILTLREKWEALANATVSCFSQSYLLQKFPLQRSNHEIWIDSRIIPDKALVETIAMLEPAQALSSEGEIIAFRPDTEIQSCDHFTPSQPPIHWKTALQRIQYPWDIFRLNGISIEQDFELLCRGRNYSDSGYANRIIAEENVFIEEGAMVNCAVLNASQGPIYIGKDAEIMEGALIRGPFALGEHSVVKMAAKIYPATSIGPYCKVGGEVSNVVFQGYSSKAHDGFLGDAVIGEWCNLGADTNNSNLKNTYEEVRVWNYGKSTFIRTGLQFCGLIMGDHSKTGINTMLNTGTVIGVSANVFGSGFPRNFIPSFTWGGAHGLTEYKFQKALDVAEAVMKRRNRLLDDTEKAILEHVYQATREHRLA